MEMSLWSNFVDSIESVKQKMPGGATMSESNELSLGGIQSSHAADNSESHTHSDESWQACNSTEQEDTPPHLSLSQQTPAEHTNTSANVTPAPELQDSILTVINKLLTAHLGPEHEVKTIEDLVPWIQHIAVRAAEREVDRLSGTMRSETTSDKIQAVLTRVQELPDDALETLFLRRSVMIDALRRVMRRVEVEDACAEWEDVAPGY
ncbi:hypothetical protein GGS21DRAFT_257576 [Xylaria nigripes]|nr:hypothetical protein GGS21DRAFT_257576 [Xylaria nigripes]